MLFEALGEARTAPAGLLAECEMLTDARYLKTRIRNYLAYAEQLFGAETAESGEALPAQPCGEPVPPPGDFDSELQRKLECEKGARDEDLRQLMASARRSLSFLLPTGEPPSKISVGESDPLGYDSELDDAFNSCEEYALTEYSSNESSNNLTYEYCFRNAEGEALQADCRTSASFDRFVEAEQRVLERKGDGPGPVPPARFLYCNEKKVPRWASDLEAVGRLCAEQKASGDLFLEAFGELKPIENLNLECVFGADAEGNSRRGESAMWNTPESRNCKKPRPRLDQLKCL